MTTSTEKSEGYISPSSEETMLQIEVMLNGSSQEDVTPGDEHDW